jgi:hypothetical protein
VKNRRVELEVIGVENEAIFVVRAGNPLVIALRALQEGGGVESTPSDAQI